MIPNNIILTWKDHTVPNYVFDNIKELNPDKNILFFQDKDCRKFLKESYGDSFVKHFDDERSGCFKADFFRYAYLYEHGGYYTDIDIEYQIPISDFVPEQLEFFSFMSAIFQTHIFQAILYVRPQHDIIKNCLHDMIKNKPNFYDPNPPHIGTPTERMFHNFITYYKANDKSKLDLGREINLNGRYACTYQNKLVAYSRYESYKQGQCFTDWEES